PARARLRPPGARDESGALEHLEVLGNRGLAHGEGLGELRRVYLTLRQSRQDGAARRIREGREGLIELVGFHCTKPFGYITFRGFTAHIRRLSRPSLAHRAAMHQHAASPTRAARRPRIEAP